VIERSWVVSTWADGAEALPSPRRAVAGGLCAILLLFLALQAWWVLNPAPGVRPGPRIVEIPPSLGVTGIAKRLDEAGVIRSPLGFILLAAGRGTARSLRAGEYEVPRGANTIGVLALLEGGRVLQHSVLFREGLTVAELGRLLEAEGLARGTDVERAARDFHFLRTLGVEAETLEGYLFPDTYLFVKGMTSEEMLARMVARMREQVTPEIIARARDRGLTEHQLLTLASIIEREAAVAGEMPLISAVFWNRFKRNMPLQADPTVQYALGDGWKTLSRADLQVESPFNTYRRLGLPPGPIASPGRAAILAAANPAPVSYLYFVSIDDRRHHFSTTLGDHNAAVERYRLARSR
jgi:UPF0755 protein